MSKIILEGQLEVIRGKDGYTQFYLREKDLRKWFPLLNGELTDEFSEIIENVIHNEGESYIEEKIGERLIRKSSSKRYRITIEEIE